MSFILKKLIKFFIFKNKIKLVKLLVKFDKNLKLANLLNKNHFSELNQTSLFLLQNISYHKNNKNSDILSDLIYANNETAILFLILNEKYEVRAKHINMALSNLKILELLLKRIDKKELNSIDTESTVALNVIARRDLKTLHLCLKYGLNLNTIVFDQMNTLHYAAKLTEGNKSLVFFAEEILKSGLDPNVSYKDEKTALYDAVVWQDLLFIQKLFEYGHDRKYYFHQEQKESYLFLAARIGSLPIFKFILSQDFDLYEVIDGKTVLDVALTNLDLFYGSNLIDFLIEKNVDVLLDLKQIKDKSFLNKILKYKSLKNLNLI